MAQHRRVRSRTTPQPDPPQQRTTRATRTTRSQSRDIDHPSIPSTARTTRSAVARGTSVESVVSDDGISSRDVRAPRGTGGRDLSIVQEDADLSYPNLPEPTAEDAIGARESIISGTTAISTARTVHDPADLDPDLMLEFLDDLCTDALKVLEIIAPRNASLEHLATVASEAINPTSKVSRILEKRADRFDEARQYFGDGDYIKRDTVLAAFADQANAYNSIHNVSPRPDAIIYRANVATFAKQMATIAPESGDVFNVLLDLDNTFPRHFVASLYDDQLDDREPGSSVLVDETFRLALDIRTQFAISLLVRDEDEPGFDPDSKLHSIFFAVPERDDTASEKPRLRGWEVLGLGAGDDALPDSIRGAVVQRIEDIRKSFRGETQDLEQGNYIDSARLQSDFPWPNFLVRVLDWVRARNFELGDEINLLGGASEIQTSLKEYLETGVPKSPGKRRGTASQSQGASTTEPESQSQRIPKTAPGVIKVLKRGLARLSNQNVGRGNDEASDVPNEAAAANGTEEHAAEDYNPPVLEEDGDDDNSRTFVNPPQERSAMQDDLEALRQREKQNKENMRRLSADPLVSPRKSFYDRQAGATRVSFDEADGSLPSEFALSAKRQGKRRRVEAESDEDEEFETRVPKRKRRVPVQKKARYAPSSTACSSMRGKGQASQEVTHAFGALQNNNDDDDDDDEGGPTPAEQLTAVSRQARAIPTVGNHAARGRKPWTQEEIDAFVELVAEFSHVTQPWKSIKRADEVRGNVLNRRRTTDLKDKAMNIIASYKMAGQDVPLGFESFTLPKHLQAKVDQRRGIRDDD